MARDGARRRAGLVNLDGAVRTPLGAPLKDGPAPRPDAKPSDADWPDLTWRGLLIALIMSGTAPDALGRGRQMRLATAVGSWPAATRIKADRLAEIKSYVESIPESSPLAAVQYQGAAIVFLEDAIEAIRGGARSRIEAPGLQEGEGEEEDEAGVAHAGSRDG